MEEFGVKTEKTKMPPDIKIISTKCPLLNLDARCGGSAPVLEILVKFVNDEPKGIMGCPEYADDGRCTVKQREIEKQYDEGNIKKMKEEDPGLFHCFYKAWQPL